MSEFYKKVRDRLIRYAKVDTQSMNGSEQVPSTAKLFDLARILRDELIEIGAADVRLDEKYCVVYGKVPGNTAGSRKLGFVAHLDTAPGVSGTDVKPWVLMDYQGQDIVLNKEKNIVMKAGDFPSLKDYIGQDLVLTDGTTLLGGDDKASIAAIMTMAEHLLAHPEKKHGDIAIAFTPDEEVGGLAKDLDLERFGSPTAYTMDGEHLGYYEVETFNASSAKISIAGRSVHPGTAKGIMVNSVDIGAEFLSLLPAYEKPQYTDGREGFFHVTSISGTCEHTEIELIVRDHDSVQFAVREEYLRKVTEGLNRKYGKETVILEIHEQYRSMKEVVEKVPCLVDHLVQAIRDCGVEPRKIAFRGGTDGSELSFRGLPCPNLGTGGYCFHGPLEHISVENMDLCVKILLGIVEEYAQHG